MEQCALRQDMDGVNAVVVPLSLALDSLIAAIAENGTQ
jgi:hypothetical protein